MDLNLTMGNASIRGYKRLPYKAWYALAEYIDNSTQSFSDYQEELNQSVVEVSIVFDPSSRQISIVDNAYGMSVEDMARALNVGMPPANPSGRSRYGMGMKTASCWFAPRWTLTSKQLGSAEEVEFTIDVDKFADDLPGATSTVIRPKSLDSHYTRIVLDGVTRQMSPARIKEIAKNLTSIFRKDIASGRLILKIDHDAMAYSGYEPESFLERSVDGGRYVTQFDEVVGGVHISGWIGCFAQGKGSQTEAGISVFQNDRCIMGAGEAWRPEELFGGARGGTVNQRLVGELNLDDPGIQVSHTKDEILWLGSQEDDIADFLKIRATEHDILKVAKRTFQDMANDNVKRDAGLAALQDWSESPGLIGQLAIAEVPKPEVGRARSEFVVEATRDTEPDFVVHVPGIERDIMVKIQQLSPNDPYCAYEIASNGDLVTVINMAHPGYLTASRSDNPLFTYFVHCAIDTWAEWKCQLIRGEIQPESVREIKNDILRHEPGI